MTRTADLVFAALMLAASLLLLYRAYGISGLAGWDAAGTVPMLATGVMSLASAAVLARALAVRRRGAAQETTPGGGVRARLAGLLPPDLLGLTALFVAYVAALSRLGFYPATFLFVTLTIVLLERGRPIFAAAVAVAAIAGIYGAFETFFQVRLP